ncbi:cation diffusion facilitator family transporter [Pseudohalocynthiibacter aestuariivivens]|jgi:cobalt-zinc-cadmium efflux system protein|uniref:Cation diffusion facilitator family transporter n=1 Tax=Pseudohalocynthiibacter aestuariivivens TaxID=1591409 RepID=A0ABV5JJG2_9RHOB|nr:MULTISPECIES: cation diffusion facilitator family transporter [Pseudohalocynthiibacter]MBS9718286.1 cation transporter [Pseudohalocynthiibacter aestuariivivens]MCK0103509.1 cation diffusion facilitator family transporter [Pseudohalocynthiibacter sp. F2068]
MPHDHHGHHGHAHIDPDAGDRRVALAVLVNFGLAFVQIVGGLLSGSLALIADAIHNLSDAVSLVIAFGARKIARRPADSDMTFGYARVETVAALINYTTLIVIGIYLIYEGVMRIFDPVGIDGWIVVIIAAVALSVDLVTAALTYTMSKDSMNIRAAFLHNLADALGSVAVIVAGTLIILYDWMIVDPIVTLMIAAYILWHAAVEIGDVIRVLMLGRPPSVKMDDVLKAMKNIDGVTGVHHVHLWQLEEKKAALQAHVVIGEGRWGDADAIKTRIRTVLADLKIDHSTLEMECSRHVCLDTPVVGH